MYGSRGNSTPYPPLPVSPILPYIHTQYQGGKGIHPEYRILGVWGGRGPGALCWYILVLGEGLYSKKIHTPIAPVPPLVPRLPSPYTRAPHQYPREYSFHPRGVGALGGVGDRRGEGVPGGIQKVYRARRVHP